MNISVAILQLPWKPHEFDIVFNRKVCIQSDNSTILLSAILITIFQSTASFDGFWHNSLFLDLWISVLLILSHRKSLFGIYHKLMFPRCFSVSKSLDSKSMAEFIGIPASYT